MKRILFLMPVLLAGVCGCMTAAKNDNNGINTFGRAIPGREVPGLVGPAGEPVTAVAAQMPSGKEGEVRQTAGFVRIGNRPMMGRVPEGVTGGCGSCASGGCSGGMSPEAYGPMQSGLQTFAGRGGILPVPAMGPYGAVAAVGAIGAQGSGMYPAMFANQRTSIRFSNPAGMKITWQTGAGNFVEPAALEAPARYNFPQANMYRLRMSGVPKHPGKTYYPTLEVYPSTPKTVTFLSHNAVPISFTDEDFDQVNAGNLVVKVVFLPDPQFQDLTGAGADEIVSTRLEPGVNPVEEANRRGTILAVIRVGNIDLQDPNTPAMDAPSAPAAPMGVPSAAPIPTAPRVPTPMPASGSASTRGVLRPGKLPSNVTPAGFVTGPAIK